MPSPTERWSSLLASHEALRRPRATAPTHAPAAAVLTCADARIDPGALFDQPAGGLFVVRIAGNTASAPAVASLDYAVDVLGVDLVIVLGHTHCGAVGAAIDGVCDGQVEAVTGPICILAREHPDDDADTLSRRNVAATVADLARQPGALGVGAREGRVEIRGAVYDLASRRIEPVELEPITDNPQTHNPTTTKTKEPA